MDFDKDQFLSDIYDRLPTTGDPVRQIDHTIKEVIDAHVKELFRVGPSKTSRSASVSSSRN